MSHSSPPTLARRLTAVLLATAALLLLPLPLLYSQPTPAERQRYLLFLADAPLATYDGRDGRYPATSPAHTGGKLDVRAPAVQAYARHLAHQRQAALAEAEAMLGRVLEPIIQFGVVANGVGVELTEEEAAVLAHLPTITHLIPEPIYHLHTDAGPAHIGATQLWNHPTLPTRGEGVVVGIFDTGIDPSNPSFSATAADGYTHSNPYGAGNYRGVCDPNQTITMTETLLGMVGGILLYDETFPCNDKLIGVWGYEWSDESPRDRNGHGSHTASTVAGNPIASVPLTAPTISFTAEQISGMAPRANLIVYDVCQDGSGACLGFAIIMAQNQAILDGVDVVNFSIGGLPAPNPWGDPLAQTWLAMREAGIFVAASAGNRGPQEGTVGSPANLPWVTSVAASSHPRRFERQLLLYNQMGQSLALLGEGLTAPSLTPTPVVLASDYVGYGGLPDDNRYCAPRHFLPTTFTGELVVCAQGRYGRLAKGQAVLAAGGSGMIMTHAYGPGGLLIGPHYLPTILLDETASLSLQTFISQTKVLGAGPVWGRITAVQMVNFAPFGDLMAPFSARGPNAGAGLAGVMVPKVTAPGRNIIAALGQGEAGDEGTPSFGVLSGTSMSSPHVAGAAVLLRALHPTWSPAEIESALMSTAVATRLDNGQTPSTPFDEGAGRIDVVAAAQAGLVLDVPAGAFSAANPALGGDPRQLNLAGLVDEQCIGRCVWTRTVKSVANQPVVWQATVEGGVAGSVSPALFTLQPGQSQTVVITAEVALPEGWQFGGVRFVPDVAAVSQARLPLAVLSTASTLSKDWLITTEVAQGMAVLTNQQAVTLTAATAELTGFAPAVITATRLLRDPTYINPYYNLNHVWVLTLTIPPATDYLVVEVTNTTARDIDLFVGQGAVPSLETELERSATPRSLERVILPEPEPGVYWVLVQNWLSDRPLIPDLVQVAWAAVPEGAAGNGWVEIPAAVPLGQPFALTVGWDEPAMVEGTRWYGRALFWADDERETAEPLAEMFLQLRVVRYYEVYLPAVAR